MCRNQDVSIKNIEMNISQLSRQIAAFPSSSGGFTSNIVDNPKNETCKVVDTNLGVNIRKDKDEIEKE